jgi:hypothetical protein
MPVTTPQQPGPLITEVDVPLHVPPPVLLVNVTVVPTHSIGVPDMEAGDALMVTTLVSAQPDAFV